MTTWALTLARARARFGVLLAIAATIAVLVLGLSAVLGAIGSAVRAAVVASVAAAPEEARSAILTIPAAADTDAQTDAATALFARLFGESLAATPLPSTDGGSLRWELTVDPDGLDPWGVPVIADDLRRLDREARDVDGLAPQGASVEGGLADTLTLAADGVRAVQAVVPVPLALIAIGGVIAALQLARLLGDARSGEAALLRARGISPSVARRWAIIELVVVATVAAAAGWVLAAALIALLGSGFGAALRATWIVPAVVAVALGIGAGIAAHRAADAPPTERAGRSRSAVTGLSAVLLVLAAAVFVWQLRGVSEGGAPSTDVWAFIVTAVAPALALAAASVLVLTLFGPLAHLVARLAARRPALAPALPARMVSRHVGAFGVVVALISLASGGAVLAGASVATWSLAGEQSAALRAGADARAAVGTELVEAGDVDAVAAETDAAAAVLAHGGSVSDVDVSLVALPDAAAADVIAPLPSAGIDPATLGDELAHGPIGTVLPPEADRLTAAFAMRGNVVTSFIYPEDGEPIMQQLLTLPTVDLLEAEAWLVDGLGTPARVPLTLELAPDPAAEGSAVLTADGVLPSGRAPWTIVGLRVGFRNSPGALEPALTPLTLSTGAGEEVEWPSTAPIVLSREESVARIAFAPVPDAVPAVVSTALAEAFGLEVGDAYDLKLERTNRVVRFEVEGFVEVVPGSDRAAGVLLPLGGVTQALFASSGSALRADQVWASGPEAADALVAAYGAEAVDTGAANTELMGSLAAAWWVATTIGGLLAAVAVIASATALARRRSSDVFVLRALGETPASQSRARLAELAVVSAGALVVGGLLGAVVAWLTLPALTLAAVPGVAPALADAVVWGWLPAGVLVALVAAAVASASIVVGRLVALQSRAGRVREAS